MTSLKILICGGGCAGPALAFWLARLGHRVVIVERHPDLRALGAQIDLRAQGIQVAKRMGLLEIIRSKRVNEAGVSFVDSRGKVQGTILANTSGQGAQSLTSEYEIMRGDLVNILYDATKDKVKYIFGRTVERFEQDEKQVLVHFSDDSSHTFDLLVGADGQGSRIRKAILPPASPDPYRRLGVYMAYWFVPRIESDDNILNIYHSPGGRMVMRRSHSSGTTQVYFALKDPSGLASHIPRAPIEEQKKFWIEAFRGAGWQIERFLKGMESTENFYCQEAVQVRADTWYMGSRVVLLGDAAHCPSPFTGMGTTGSLVGAYVLAGEISRSPEELAKALANYDATLRPFVDEIQTLNAFFLRLVLPETRWGVYLLHFVVSCLCFLRIPDLVARFSRAEQGGWRLPDYPGLQSDAD